MFYEIFKELCDKIGKSPNAVCKELGFSNAQATHWKNGKMPNAEALVLLSGYFNVSTDLLLGRLNDEAKKEPPIVIASMSDYIELLDSLSDTEIEELKNYVGYMLWRRDNSSEQG